MGNFFTEEAYESMIGELFCRFPSFQKVGAGAYKPGIANMEFADQLMGHPHRKYRIIHVAGTNGKGSVSNMLASVLAASGLKTGLYTSPHILDFRERMRVVCDGSYELVSKEYVWNFFHQWKDTFDHLDMSFFEITTLMAFAYFKEQAVDVAVIEVGLGGRLDSTNIITPILSIITNISFDHTAFLGNTLTAIAAEKAGIIKKSIPVVIGEASEEYNGVIEERAQELGSAVIYAEREFLLHGVEHFDNYNQHFSIERVRDSRVYELDLDLLGDYQRHNIITACAAADYLAERTPLTISRRAFREGIASAAANTGLMGRWQLLAREPYTVCDTGHNCHGMRYVAQQLDALECDRLFCVMGFAKDKALEDIMALLPKRAHYIFTRASIDRARAIEDIAVVADKLGLDYECVDTVPAAVERAKALALPADAIFIGGSNFVVAEI